MRNKPSFDATYCVGDFQSRLQIPLERLRKKSFLHVTNGIINAWEILSAKNYAPVDLLIPAPVSEKTLALRGFNQAWEICKGMAKHKKILATPKLIKIRTGNYLAPQAKTMRTQFLKEALYLDADELQKIGGLAGKRIGVIDDFMHTGATLDAIANLLKQNNASWVSNWVILRTPSPELY